MALKDIKQGDPVLTGGLAAITSPTVIPDEASRLDRIGILADKYSPMNIAGAGLDALTLGAENVFDYFLSPDPYGEARATREAQDQAYLEDVQRRVAEKQADDRAGSMDIFSDMEIANRNRDSRFITDPDFSGAQSEVRGTGEPSEVNEPVDAQAAAEAGGVQRDGIAGADTPIKQATVTALDEYLKQARPGVSPGSYDEYMKEFGEATGLDVSGEPDNRAALMAFGLALMQNKAGKGFDVGQMLSSVGQAGEKALPALEKARANAQALRAKAGEYALSRKKEDQAAAMNRTGYYVVPRKGGFVNNFDKGRIVRLNSYELNALDQNTKFGQDYEIVPMEVYETVAKEAFKTPELGNKYASSYDSIALFTDAPDDLSISVQRVDANYKGADRPPIGHFNKGEYETYRNRLSAMDADLDKFGERIGEAYSIVKSGQTTTLDQVTDAAIGFGNALGLDLTGEPTPTAKVKRILKVIAADKAPEILGEAGKTISDADRARVQEIVGELGMTTDPNLLARALTEMYDRIVIGGKKDIQMGMTTLNRYAGVADEPKQSSAPKGVMTEDGVLDLTQ